MTRRRLAAGAAVAAALFLTLARPQRASAGYPLLDIAAKESMGKAARLAVSPSMRALTLPARHRGPMEQLPRL